MNQINRCIFLYTQKKIYVKQGFDKYEKKIKNYSIDYYSEEIELPISGNKDDFEKMLLNKNFEIFYKVLTISNYYLPINEDDSNHKTLKEKCKRIRYVEPVCKYKNKWQTYKEWIKHYDIDECIKEENNIIAKGYKNIYTDIKTDYVYKNIKEDEKLWMTQDQISKLFDKAKSTINEHIKNIYEEGELKEEFSTKPTNYYNL